MDQSFNIDDMCHWCNLKPGTGTCAACNQTKWCSEACRHAHWADNVDSHAFYCIQSNLDQELDESFDGDNVDTLINVMEDHLEECADNPHESDSFIALGNALTDELVDQSLASHEIPQELSDRALAWINAKTALSVPRDALPTADHVKGELNFLAECALDEYCELVENTRKPLAKNRITERNLGERYRSVESHFQEFNTKHAQGTLTDEDVEHSRAFIEADSTRAERRRRARALRAKRRETRKRRRLANREKRRARAQDQRVKRAQRAKRRQERKERRSINKEKARARREKRARRKLARREKRLAKQQDRRARQDSRAERARERREAIQRRREQRVLADPQSQFQSEQQQSSYANEIEPVVDSDRQARFKRALGLADKRITEEQ